MTMTTVRNIAATLLALAGIGHITLLWIADINLPLLISVSFGAVYLFIAIGLYGQSRFALFTAIIVPGTGAALAIRAYSPASFNALSLGLLSVELLVILLSAAVLFSVRNNPSV